MSSASVEARIMIGPLSYRLAKSSLNEVTLRQPIRALIEIEVDGKLDQRLVTIAALKIDDVNE